MRPHFLTPALLFLAACSDSLPARVPPLDNLAFPSALVLSPSATQGGNGTLYVASSNFDKFYDNGAVMAVNLDALVPALPPFAAAPPAPRLTDRTQFIPLNVTEESRVLVQSITGEMALWDRSATEKYLFVPSRSEGNLLQVVQANGTALHCIGTDSNNCATRAITLGDSIKTPEELASFPAGQPAAPAPFGVTVGERTDINGTKVPELWVTHIDAALPEKGENRAQQSATYLVKTNPEQIVTALQTVSDSGPFRLPAADFLPLTSIAVNGRLAGGNAVALGTKFAYVSGRGVTVGQGGGGSPPFLLRALDRVTPTITINPPLQASYPDIEARGVAVNESETRVYLAGRVSGSTLLVGQVSTATNSISAVRAINTLPPGASEVKVLSRNAPGQQGRGDLVLVSCTGAGVLAIYDDEVGDIVAQVPDLGDQPYAIAVDRRTLAGGGFGARIYVSNFGDGQVSVIDIDNLDTPQAARVVARLGALQNCASDNPDESCPEDLP